MFNININIGYFDNRRSGNVDVDSKLNKTWSQRALFSLWILNILIEDLNDYLL